MGWLRTTLVGICLVTIMATTPFLSCDVAANAASAPWLVVAQLDVMSAWGKVITDIGILSGLVFFFTWTAWKREERLAKRITNLEEFATQDLMDCTRRTTETIHDNTVAVKELVMALHQRPCLQLADHGSLNDYIAKIVQEVLKGGSK